MPTHDFAQPSEENIGDSHKKIAKAKRTSEAAILEQNTMLGLLTPLNTQVDTESLKIEDQSLFGGAAVIDLHPIIFEEAYVKEGDPKFVKIIKSY